MRKYVTKEMEEDILNNVELIIEESCATEEAMAKALQDKTTNYYQLAGRLDILVMVLEMVGVEKEDKKWKNY